MYKSKVNYLQNIYQVAPVFLFILSICSLFPGRLAIAIDSSSISREKSYSIAQSESVNQQLRTKDLPTKSNTNPPNVEQIKQVAKTQNATLVQYSILYDDVNIDGKKQTQESKLLTWVIKPTGEILMRRVNLQGKRDVTPFSFFNLIRRSRRVLGARSVGVELEKGIEKEVEKGITTTNNTTEKPSKSELKELHQILIAPIADLLPQKSEEAVIFIPQGDLSLVSFATLQDNNGKYLIEKHTISTAPSIQVLDLLHQRKNKRKGTELFTPANIKGDELLIVGNPTAPKVPFKPGEEICRLSPLPGAEKEARNIAKMFNTQALIGDAATETAIVKKMPQARIIHLGTYTFPFVDSTDGKNCDIGDSTGVIALASSTGDDGWLKTEEIQQLKLNANLVVLAGCNTAGGKITGDGVIGLSRTFLAAGADTVIGSLWNVSDTSTVMLMSEFYASLSKNTDKAGALRQAMLQTMKKYPNPQDWGGFTLIGLL